MPLLNDDPTSPDTRLPFLPIHNLGANDIEDSHYDLDGLVNSNTMTPLPSSRFVPRSLLGAGSRNGDREMMGHLYASQIASAITTKNPDESRVLVLGLGMPKVEMERAVFAQVVDLVVQVI